MPGSAEAGRGKPRLLILTPDYPPALGGIQVSSERYARCIDGFEVRVITLDESGAREYDAARELDAARPTAVTRVGARRLPRGARNALLNADALARALAFRPDVTLSMHIVTSPAAAAIRRRTAAPMVQLFHAEEVGARPRLAHFAAREADAIVAVSEYTASLVGALGPARARTHLVPPGVDLPADAAPALAPEPTVVTISRLEERYKGHDTLARAWPLVLAKEPSARWVVIGEGRLRSGVEALLSAYGARDSVAFLGAVDDRERDRWLRRAHVLAMPSRLPGGGFAGEGFGIAYVEAGAFGKPVVACGVGGALDSIADGESGILVEPDEPLALAAAITRLLQDRELARRLGDAGRVRAESRTWSHAAARMRAVLLETIEASKLLQSC